jgi:hypothetical protein
VRDLGYWRTLRAVLVTIDAEDDTKYRVYEQYTDQAALDHHLNGEAHAMAKEFFSNGGLVEPRELAKAYLLDV